MKDTIGQRIKEQRKKMNMTQEELAGIICVPKSTISAYENNKVDIKGSVLVELSEYLHTTPNYLLGYGFEDEETMEMINLYKCICDEKIRRVILAQVKAIAASYYSM